MSSTQTTGLTIADWLARGQPDDGWREEIIDGELVRMPSPGLHHQGVSVEITVALRSYAMRHGGAVFPTPGVRFADDTGLMPDVVYVSDRSLLSGRLVEDTPALVVEISSPSTRRYDLGRKRATYQRFGVPEYWFVDLTTEEILVHHLDPATGAYASPQRLGRGDTLVSSAVQGFTASVADLLGEPGTGLPPTGSG